MGSSDQLYETVLVHVERIREQAQAFQREIERELRTTRSQLEDLQVRSGPKR